MKKIKFFFKSLAKCLTTDSLHDSLEKLEKINKDIQNANKRLEKINKEMENENERIKNNNKDMKNITEELKKFNEKINEENIKWREEKIKSYQETIDLIEKQNNVLKKDEKEFIETVNKSISMTKDSSSTNIEDYQNAICILYNVIVDTHSKYIKEKIDRNISAIETFKSMIELNSTLQGRNSTLQEH
jgi:chromosome segregation ATPase